MRQVPQKPRSGTRVYIAMVAVTLLASPGTLLAHDDARGILFFDPDANYDAMPNVVVWFNEFLATNLPGYTFRAVSSVEDLTRAIQSGEAAYAIVTSSLLSDGGMFEMRPLLVQQGEDGIYYLRSSWIAARVRRVPFRESSSRQRSAAANDGQATLY